MSDAAVREREVKRQWALPGGAHDRLVRTLKLALPIFAGALLLMLAIAPFSRRGDVSFILNKKDVDKAAERLKVENARYVGRDEDGAAYVILADRAVQPTSRKPVVSIEGMRARVGLEKGPLAIVALNGVYDLDHKTIDILGPVHVSGPEGYKLATRDVAVDLDRQRLVSRGAVSGSMKIGTFEAGALSADLDRRTVQLNGGVRLKIRQGAVR